MLGALTLLGDVINSYRFTITAPRVIQTLSTTELFSYLSDQDGWIVGDDMVNFEVLNFAKSNGLKSLIKWGVGVDNIDIDACKKLGIKFSHTPRMFGDEVADVALGYVIALARRTFEIDRLVRNGDWPKFQGISLRGKVAAIIGYGDIGSSIGERLRSIGMGIIAYDPNVNHTEYEGVEFHQWPNYIESADYIVVSCSLNAYTTHLLNNDIFNRVKKGVKIVNISRGGVIDQAHLEMALYEGIVSSAALEVFEQEPPDINSDLLKNDKCIFGSHNASNTLEAVLKTSKLALDDMAKSLNIE